MSQSQRRFLQQLRDAGDAGFPASDIASGCSGVLRDLQTCGAVSCRPAGRGTVVYISNPAAFDLFIESRHPLGLANSLNDVEDRASGVQLFADAKTARRGRWEGLFVRSTSPRGTLVSERGIELRVNDITATAGGAAILLGGCRRWSFRGVVALVENAEAFWQHDRVLPEVDLAVFSCGRLSERALTWLASDEMAECQLVHWGDYDPVGCLEYLRLAGRCAGRVKMHLPVAVAELLPRFGKPQLILDQVAELDALRHAPGDASVSALLRLFDAHRKGLEQEALLMSLEGEGSPADGTFRGGAQL